MRHFIILINYKVPEEKVNKVRLRHRKFLETGYEKGIVLFSGPQVPRTGGLIAARGVSLDEVKTFFEEDPYQKERAAEYQFIEFEPVHFQQFMDDWIKDK
jgi:uncharacterized protein YciI